MLSRRFFGAFLVAFYTQWFFAFFSLDAERSVDPTIAFPSHLPDLRYLHVMLCYSGKGYTWRFRNGIVCFRNGFEIVRVILTMLSLFLHYGHYFAVISNDAGFSLSPSTCKIVLPGASDFTMTRHIPLKTLCLVP